MKLNIIKKGLIIFTMFISLVSCQKKTEDCIDDIAKNAKTESGVSVGVSNCYLRANESKEKNYESKKTNQICKFFWNDETIDFETANESIKNDSNYKETYVIKTGKENEVHSLELLLIDADKKNNSELAKSIAKTMSENLITIFYKKHLSEDFIFLEVNGKNLRQRCID